MIFEIYQHFLKQEMEREAIVNIDKSICVEITANLQKSRSEPRLPPAIFPTLLISLSRSASGSRTVLPDSIKFPTQSGNTSCSELVPGLPDWARFPVQCGHAPVLLSHSHHFFISPSARKSPSNAHDTSCSNCFRLIHFKMLAISKAG